MNEVIRTYTHGMQVEPRLVDLAEQVWENWQSQEMARRRELWKCHFRCERPGKIPVKCAVFDFYDLVWQQLIPAETLVFKDGLARQIEIQLRIKLEKFRRLRDDDVILPNLWARVDRNRSEDSLWGVPIRSDSTADIGGAYKPVPPLKNEADLERVCSPAIIPLHAEEQQLTEAMATLTGNRLPISMETDELHYGPYEWAVRMRGAEQLLYDVYDRPEWVHRLMDRITTGMVAYHMAREAAGMYDFWADLPRITVPYDEEPVGNGRKLAGGWVYAHAQSAASLGPAMYAEFVQPYNARITELFHKVYYHGCENLEQKAQIIRDLPNLTIFHVSPWTRVSEVVPVLRGRPVVLEVHSHPTDVLFNWGTAEMRTELRQRIAEAEDMAFDLILCDIQTIQGADGQLERWTEVAMEESVR